MSSVLKVSSIQDPTNSNTALSIDSSGRVTMANTVEIDMWMLTASHTTNADISSGWSRPPYATASYAGTGMTESSGVFTFPSTGLWKVTGTFFIVAVSGDTSAGIIIQVSTNSGTNFTTTGGCFASESINNSSSFQTLVNVTNASTTQFKLVSSGLNSGSNITGDASRDYSSLIFERITDAQ